MLVFLPGDEAGIIIKERFQDSRFGNSRFWGRGLGPGFPLLCLQSCVSYVDLQNYSLFYLS
jgi:hypothetical protein